MAVIKYELVAKAGTYQKGGEEKIRWHKCGVVMQTAKGLTARVESLPVNFDGWLNLWEPKPKDGKPDKPDADDEGDGRIPF